LFQKIFTIPGSVISATVAAGADDDVLSFKINGSSSIFNDANGTAGPPFGPVSTALFVTGTNTILAQARNTGGPTTFWAGVSIEYDPSPVPLPPALLLFASALGITGLVARWRRRRDALAPAH